MSRFYKQLVRTLGESQPFALALISKVHGSSPQKRGAKALFLSDGRIIGTLGGGCLEAEVQDRARRSLRNGQPATFELVLDHDFGWDDGLICGGKVEGLILPHARDYSHLWQALAQVKGCAHWGVRADYSVDWYPSAQGSAETDAAWIYTERVMPPEVLWIAGSGHIAQAVAVLAHSLEFETWVFDDRPALANAAHFPNTQHFRVNAWEELLQESPSSPHTYGLIVTRGHQHDAQVLKSWIRHPFVFLGMIGSRRKARIMREQFLKQGMATEKEWMRLSCPVGLDLQGQSVEEIAVSIVAELIQKRAANRMLQEAVLPRATAC